MAPTPEKKNHNNGWYCSEWEKKPAQVANLLLPFSSFRCNHKNQICGFKSIEWIRCGKKNKENVCKNEGKNDIFGVFMHFVNLSAKKRKLFKNLKKMSKNVHK